MTIYKQMISTLSLKHEQMRRFAGGWSWNIIISPRRYYYTIQLWRNKGTATLS